MNLSIGVVDHGEFSGSIVAVYSPMQGKSEFGEFRAWTPHRYVLSVEENEVPGELCVRIYQSLDARVDGDGAEVLAAKVFDDDYARVVRGPHEGRLLRVPHHFGESQGAPDALISLAIRIPLLRAMADPDLLAEDLRDALGDFSDQGGSDRAVSRLLTFCAHTQRWGTNDQVSPDMAVRMWFASLKVGARGKEPELQQSFVRDARRMVEAILDPKHVWVSGDWSDSLCEVVRLAASRLASGRAAG